MNGCDSATPYFADYQAITQSLQCPVCGGQRISSSDAAYAQSVKSDVCAKLKQGLTRDEVIAQIETEYGQSMHVDMPIATIVPFGIIMVTIIAMLVAAYLRRTN